MAIERTPSGAVIFTGSDIERYRLVAIKSALRLEAAGMRVARNGSALAAAKAASGLKARTAADMLPKYTAWLEVKLAPVAEPAAEAAEPAEPAEPAAKGGR